MQIRKAEEHMQTSLRGIAKRAKEDPKHKVIGTNHRFCTKRVIPRSPVRENRTQGSVRGRSGNWLVYLNGLYREYA